MTGPEHYREAERLLAERNPEAPESAGGIMFYPAPGIDLGKVAQAQVHATLALAAATAAHLSPIASDQLAATSEWSGVTR